MRIMLPWFLSMMLCVSVLPKAKADITLVENGAAKAKIVVSRQAPESVQFAAKELQTYLKKISGAKLPLVAIGLERSSDDGLDPAEQNLILIGDSFLTQAMNLPGKAFKPDGFLIETQNKRLVIMGRDDPGIQPEHGPGNWGSAGTLYGVYRFLETLGVRWYFPGQFGEVIPSCKDIALKRMDLQSAPYCTHRYMLNLSTGFAADGLWLRRVGFGGTVCPGSMVHPFVVLKWHERHRWKHPEWFVQLDEKGSRGIELCWYAPGIREEMIKEVKKYFVRTDSRYPDYTLLGQDGIQPLCVCAECSRHVTPEEGWSGERSDYVAQVAVEIADAVRGEYPEGRILISAYNQQTRPPRRIQQLPPNVAVVIAKGALYRWQEEYSWYDDVLEDWLKLKPAYFACWEYYGADGWGKQWGGAPMLATRMIVRDMQKLQQLADQYQTPFLGEMIYGADERAGKDVDATRGYWYALDLYVTAKALWNPKISAEDIMSEYCDLFFGPSGKPMKKFYDRLESAWWHDGKSPVGRRCFNIRGQAWNEYKKDNFIAACNPWEILFTPAVLKELAQYLAEGRAKAQGSPYRERIKMVEDGFRVTLSRAVMYGAGNSTNEVNQINDGLW